MTLDLAKFISNSIKTQAKIQHFAMSTKTVKDVPNSVKEPILAEYGENYLLDADYVTFFWGEISKDDIKKLFNVVDKALGKSANRLTDADFKKIALKDDTSTEEEQDDSQAETEDIESQEDSTEEKEETSAEETTSTDDSNETDEETLDESDEQPKKTSYFFLKITLKK